MGKTADLVIRAGRLFRGHGEIEGPGYVATSGDRILAIGAHWDGDADRQLDFPDGILLPGLVDLHAHPAANSESKYGTNPDREFLPRGVTTVMSQGDAGADNWPSYLKNTIKKCRTRIRLALNLAAPGEVAEHACFERLSDIDVQRCVETINSDREELIWGIAINVSRIACAQTDPKEVMRRGLEAAERSGKPILYGMREPGDWPLDDQLAQLRPGDVVTYCFRPPPVTVVQDGRVHPAVVEARNRGVLFDIGHGMASLCFDIAEAALADGFQPDTVSTDQYARHEGSDPQHDLPLTASKLMAVGMPLNAVLRAITSRPAEVLGLAAEVGTLMPDRVADICVLGISHAEDTLLDVGGDQRIGDRWQSACVVRAGQLVD
jgi:dihydroorotase